MCIAVRSHRMMAGAPMTPALYRRAQHSTHTWGDARNPFGHRRSRQRDGAFMEPSGRNRWQPVANGTPPKTAQTSRSATVATHGNRFGAHGKEGVDGSSPSEGSAKAAHGDSLARTTCLSDLVVVLEALWG